MNNYKQFFVKKEINNLQNELLWLFVKYKLAFRYKSDMLEELPVSIDQVRGLLVRCLMHAVCSNHSNQYPQMSMEVKKEQENYWIEIKSSGAPSCFFQAFESYCSDSNLLEYLRMRGSMNPFQNPETVQVEADKESNGSLIRFAFQGKIAA